MQQAGKATHGDARPRPKRFRDERASLPEAKRPRSNAPTDDSDATIYFDSESPPVRAPTLRRPAASPLPRPDVKLAGVDMLCHDDIPTVVAGSLETMRRRELEYAPSPRFLDWHPGLSPGMRAVLVDWLMNVAFEFILKRETLHSAVNLMDRYLSKVPNVHLSELQLIGITALGLAAKVEEVYPPDAASFAASTDGTCSRNSIASMEHCLLTKVQWRMVPTTAVAWLEWYTQGLALELRPLEQSVSSDAELPVTPACVCSSAVPPGEGAADGAQSSGRARDSPRQVASQSRRNDTVPLVPVQCRRSDQAFLRAMAMLDLALLDYGHLRFLPSLLAAAALAIVLDHDERVFHVTQHSRTQLWPCVQYLRALCEGAPLRNVAHDALDVQEMQGPPPDMATLQTRNSKALAHIKSWTQRQLAAAPVPVPAPLQPLTPRASPLPETAVVVSAGGRRSASATAATRTASAARERVPASQVIITRSKVVAALGCGLHSLLRPSGDLRRTGSAPPLGAACTAAAAAAVAALAPTVAAAALPSAASKDAPATTPPEPQPDPRPAALSAQCFASKRLPASVARLPATLRQRKALFVGSDDALDS